MLRWKLLLFVATCCLGVLFLYLYAANDNSGHYFLGRNFSSYKTILYWNDFFGSKDYLGNGAHPFLKCPVSTCYITSDRQANRAEDFDAVIFHAAEYNVWSHGKPAARKANQRYIFYNLETTVNRKIDKFSAYFFFNWTMTYRRNSDIFAPYARLELQNRMYKLPAEEFVRKKRKSVAWFVSNCHTRSRREEYAAELAKHVPVDIYGHCGPKTCSKLHYDDCYRMVEHDYLFYLSFENSYCEDYVTEKVYRVLQYNVIPVVLGLANYTALVPPHSVINTADFQTPKALAKYLQFLRDNPKEYLKYFEWKKHYRVNTYVASYVLCSLCEKLHNDNTTKIYNDMNTWWDKGCSANKN